jgi:hypothetical protein
VGLLDVFVTGAPEDDAAGDAADGDGDLQITGDTQEIGFHARGRDFRAQMNADGLGG